MVSAVAISTVLKEPTPDELVEMDDDYVGGDGDGDGDDGDDDD